jgi:3-oxoacyl-[acyl-carrier-protein] synthase II
VLLVDEDLGIGRADERHGRRRVVITGLGAVTPLASDATTSWKRLIDGRSAAGPIVAFDPSGFPVRFACEAKDFDPTGFIEHRQARRMDRFTQLIVTAARQAEFDSGIMIEKESDRVGASVATAMGGLKSFEDCYDTLLERGPERVNPFSILAIIPNMGAAWVSIELGTRGPLSSQCTACAASQMAIGDGLDAIRLGRAEVMLCGGTDAAITPSGIAGFSAMRALSRRNDNPQAASRPFDADRDGFVIGEAAAILVLEELEHANQRDAKIYAELVGYGVSSDAQHITEPDPTGEHPARAIRMAFADAGINPDEIDYINAHGTSTPLGDASETRVIKIALGEENQDAGLLDEGRDRALPRRRRRPRSDLLHARNPPRRPAADDQLPDTRPPMRPRLHPEPGPRGQHPGRRLELIRLRRTQRLPRATPLRGIDKDRVRWRSLRCGE